MTTMRNLLAIAAVPLLAALVRGQTIHIVGPGGFGDLDQAYAAAQPNDVILVRQDTFFTNLIGKGVRIYNDGSWVLRPPFGATWSRIANVPAGQTLVLAGFEIRPVGQSLVNAGGMITIENCPGTVIWSGCSLRADQIQQIADQQQLSVTNCADVQFFDCTLRGRNARHLGICTQQGTDGLRVDNSTVILSQCSLVGGNYAESLVCGFTRIGGRGLTTINSSVYAIGTSFDGGSQSSLQQDIDLSGGSVWGPRLVALFGSGTYYTYGPGSGPFQVGGSINVVDEPTDLPLTQATLTATALDLSASAQALSAPVVFAFGQSRLSLLGGANILGPLLLDPSTPISLLVSASTSTSIPLSAATLTQLRYSTLAVVAASFGAGGELLLGPPDFVRF
ncbi:MAG: hypothetical protein MUC36_18520 [Planctomycetes bacterium]|jgi:hypothetical protein|nr:hypothetical protein [Planctomycetota bacterium]